MFGTLCASLLALSSLVSLLLLYTRLGKALNARSTRAMLGTAKHVLLVIAHPDDESMFFAPCVTGLLRSGAAVHVLCLSTGDADGQGGVRPAELVRACVSLGVPPHRITCVDHPLMRDGLRNDWPASTVAAAVAEGADACRAAAVVTFDASGVSGHPNHAATCAGCRLLEPRLPVWHLRSVPAAAGKFCGPLLAPARALALSISSLLSTRARQQQRPRDVVFVASPPFAAAAGLRRHASQARWYRSVFVSLAATAYVNTLHRHGGG